MPPKQRLGMFPRQEWTGPYDPEQSAMTEFHLFPTFPAEIRVKIWKEAAKVPRFIRLHSGNMFLQHQNPPIYKPHKQWQPPPAILHVNMEAREEGLKIYQLRRFDGEVVQAGNQDLRPKPIYYNPNADIILFGKHVCGTGLVHFFSKEGANAIPRVAFETSVGEQSGRTCWKCETCKLDVPPHTGRHGPIDLTGALHGVNLRSNMTGQILMWNGCPGPKEIFFVVSSEIWPLFTRNLRRLGYRHATSNGTWRGERISAKYFQGIEKVLENHGVKNPNDLHYMWKGANKPSFELISFAPLNPDGRYHDAMELSLAQWDELGAGNWYLVAEAQRQIRAESGGVLEILVPSGKTDENDIREIGFWGDKSLVEKAKHSIRQYLDFTAACNVKKAQQAEVNTRLEEIRTTDSAHNVPKNRVRRNALPIGM